MVALSTKARANKKAIVSKQNQEQVLAGDHDFSYANIIPSAVLFANIPDNSGGSWFGGGEEGIGTIDVTVKDACF